jgi:uncharacterized protein YceH (UPF0502 family)
VDSALQLSAEEARVLGALIEKQITTPEYYPLTLNALVNACNQLTNREPVVSYDEEIVRQAVEALRLKSLAALYHGAESRVARYKHTLGDVLLLTPSETAVLCVLLLRGPQTVGELRARCERLYRFESIGEVEETLSNLAAHQPSAIVAKLPRQPGTKESRHAHLLSGTVTAVAEIVPAATSPSPSPQPPRSAERIAQLEADIAAARKEISELRQQFAEFKKQFE